MIRTHGLRKTYKGGVEAVAGLDLEVEAGQIAGLLGPNGAGKTTAMRMLATLLRPTAGTAAVAGHDLLADPQGVRRSIGYVSQHGGSGLTSPLGEELVLQAMLYGMRAGQARRRVGEVLELLGVAGLETRTGAELSGGQRRRFDLAFGLLHRPRVLFLDEPTASLDPDSRATLWRHVKGLGITTVVSTHLLEEAQALCDRLLIMNRGRIVASGTPEELTAGRSLLETYQEAVGA
ncbi:ABC transporter ATP-binding protein [Thermoactinospora rubra]|uniref:ABC transporter ATP-binding protein n=1 Tax=Thermoactinospora rubra TaxID=1088767 RepID=UPI000A119A62|nr:ABC transporter ATP-binding protein [Thermoactinospora rubra]